MKRILLLSGFANNKEKYLDLIFPEVINEKRLAYLPVNGSQSPLKFRREWKGYAEKYDAEFVFIDNISASSKEAEKLLSCNILVISGGNTFELLRNLRKFGLDGAIKQFTQKNEFVLAGFSAGALVLTPTIKVCEQPGFDPNQVRLTDLKGLSLVDFETWPHYDETQKSLLESYRQHSEYEVKAIRDGEYVKVLR